MVSDHHHTLYKGEFKSTAGGHLSQARAGHSSLAPKQRVLPLIIHEHVFNGLTAVSLAVIHDLLLQDVGSGNCPFIGIHRGTSTGVTLNSDLLTWPGFFQRS